VQLNKAVERSVSLRDRDRTLHEADGEESIMEDVTTRPVNI
jgi:hypothetical protein